MEIQADQFSTIMTKLGMLEEGIKGIHRRQDITNGRIAKTEEKVIDLEKKNISIGDAINLIKDRNDGEDKQKENAENNRKQALIRIGERVLWMVVALLGIVLTKLGIINLNIGL